jgi:methylenetetrahydrofolate reductase (NADPH)
MGITIPIIPGIKPLAKLTQLTVVPKTFHCDIPEPLAKEIRESDNAAPKQVFTQVIQDAQAEEIPANDPGDAPI